MLHLKVAEGGAAALLLRDRHDQLDYTWHRGPTGDCVAAGDRSKEPPLLARHYGDEGYLG